LATRLLQQVDRVYSPGGGTHHGRPDRASGFCYLNDIVLGMLSLLDQGARRIAYVDLDAHHGDGVQDALSHDDRVLIVSVHEADRWPKTGTIDDKGGGNARNLPVPAGFHDAELSALTERLLVPWISGFDPEVLIIQGGSDAVADDPLSKLALTNRALWTAIQELLSCSPKVIVLGGGGYNPWTVGRCWAGVWATMTGQDVNQELTLESRSILTGLKWDRLRGAPPKKAWLDQLADARTPQAVRPVIDSLIQRAHHQ
ncbi:MAG: acetoin utilization protein AcuC, partial [Okeania sp. SIO3C4]|nr:acetoin utilization protein AcuC [Okeania sp. SIO3C4]